MSPSRPPRRRIGDHVGVDAASLAPDAEGELGSSTGPAWARAVLLPGAITLWCLHSLLAPGYVLQIDSIFGPNMPLSLSWVGAPLTLVAHLLGGYWSGRLYLGLAIFLCGFGPMVLVRRVTWVAQVPAGLLGALNPFVYERMVEGQWGVAAGAGMLFLWLSSWEALLQRPSLRRLALVSGAGWLAVVLDQHTIGVLLVLAAASLVWRRAWREPRALVWALTSFVVLLAALSYSLPAFFLGHENGTYYSVEHFSRADLVEFRSTASPRYGLWVNLLGLYGFWAERLGRIPMLDSGSPWWPLGAGVFAALTIAGAWTERERAWLFGCGVLGLLVAGSTSTGPGQTAFLWLMQRIPLIGAYREPEKWSELWLLAVVVLSATLIDRLRRPPAHALLSGAMSLVLVAATLLPAGAAMLRELPATVRPARYPTDWYQAASYMRHNVPESARVLVLPWTLYEELPFTGNVLSANPAPVFFPGTLVSPSDIQIPGAVTEARAPGNLTKIALAPLAPDCALAKGIRRLGISWVLVEPAPGSAQVESAVLTCGFHIRFGQPPGLVLLGS